MDHPGSHTPCTEAVSAHVRSPESRANASISGSVPLGMAESTGALR